MPRDAEDSFWLKPKWLVAGVALAAFAILAHFDPRLGIAAGALFGVVLAVWLYLALRYGSLSGAPSLRTALVERSRQHLANRRKAASRGPGRSGPEQGANPADRP